MPLTQKEIEVFGKEIDLALESELEKYFSTVPYARHLINLNEPLNEEYYLRHRIETIKRIRLTCETDSLALAKMTGESYSAARRWGRYTIQEMNHDKMFLADLKVHGLTESDVFQIAPFEATKKLIKFLKNGVETIGPIVAVAYSLFVEWNADRCAHLVVEKVEKKYDYEHVRGSKAHVTFDESHDHYQVILEIAYELISRQEPECSKSELMTVLKDISSLFREYFAELYQETIAVN